MLEAVIDILERP